MRYSSRSYRGFTLVNTLFLAAIGILCILPLVHILAVSFSSRAAATANIVTFWPVGFTLDAYTQTMANESFILALYKGVERTLLGAGIAMVLCVLAAYALAKQEAKFKGRSIYMWLFVITMLFSGGLIPAYLVVTNTGLYNTVWALVIPGAVNIWNIILMLNFFRTIPSEMEEAAHIDGAGHFRTLWTIYLPISLPSLATLGLFELVNQWNSWFDGVIYLQDTEKYPLATFLRTVIVNDNLSSISMDASKLVNISNRTVKAAQIFIGALPILLVYPFLQKYFVKGIILGSVKE